MALITKDNIKRIAKAQHDARLDELGIGAYFENFYGDYETGGFNDVFGGIVTDKMEEQLKELEENLAKAVKIPKDRFHVGGYAADAALGLSNDAKITVDPELAKMVNKLMANSFYGNYWGEIDRYPKNVWPIPSVAGSDKILSIIPSELTA